MPEQAATSGYPRCVLWGDRQLTRPTTASSRGCKLWSRQRQFYEDVRASNMRLFQHRPYLRHQYPEIGKHYPGTWRVGEREEVDEMVLRLSRPTTASRARDDDIAQRQQLVTYIVETEKAKDVVRKKGQGQSRDIHSATPRLEGNYPYRAPSAVGRSTLVSRKDDKQSVSTTHAWWINRKYDKWGWAFSRDLTRSNSALPEL